VCTGRTNRLVCAIEDHVLGILTNRVQSRLVEGRLVVLAVRGGIAPL
jgi:hypothetical protein